MNSSFYRSAIVFPDESIVSFLPVKVYQLHLEIRQQALTITLISVALAINSQIPDTTCTACCCSFMISSISIFSIFNSFLGLLITYYSISPIQCKYTKQNCHMAVLQKIQFDRYRSSFGRYCFMAI